MPKEDIIISVSNSNRNLIFARKIVNDNDSLYLTKDGKFIDHDYEMGNLSPKNYPERYFNSRRNLIRSLTKALGKNWTIISEPKNFK